MAVINTAVTKPTMKCKDVIGVRGVCDKTYPYYLDSMGISLAKASKLADSTHVTGKNLVDEAVEFGWEQVFKDLRIDGFSVNGVRSIFKSDFADTVSSVGTYTTSISRNCDIEQIFLNSLKIEAVGNINAKLSIIYDGTETVFYDDVLDDEVLTVNIDGQFNTDEITFKLVSSGTGTLRNVGDGVIYYDAYTMCSEQLFFCKYWNYLVQAVMIQSTVYILNSTLFSDRYNDFSVYKHGEIEVRISQLDSNYNLLNPENRINKKGLYQIEIERIDEKLKQIVKQSYCTCCFECDNIIQSKITIP